MPKDPRNTKKTKKLQKFDLEISWNLAEQSPNWVPTERGPTKICQKGDIPYAAAGDIQLKTKKETLRKAMY